MTTERNGKQPAELLPGEGFKSHDSHGFADTRSKPIAYHGSSTARQLAGVGAGGMAHATPAGGQPSNVLSKPPQLKVTAPPRAHPSMRSRTTDTEGAAPGVNHAKASRTLDTVLGQKIRDQASHIAGSHLIDHQHNGRGNCGE
jgi:hypothetical protein